MRRRVYTTIDEYIQAFPDATQGKLKQLRRSIRQAAPQAREKISYQMPTFFLEGNLVHFAAYARHIGFYPTSSGIATFRDALAGYKSSKGAVQFPLDEPLPLGLIRRIVEYRVREQTTTGRRSRR